MAQTAFLTQFSLKNHSATSSSQVLSQGQSPYIVQQKLHANLLLGLHFNPASSKKSPSLNSSSCVATHGSAWPSVGSGEDFKGTQSPESSSPPCQAHPKCDSHLVAPGWFQELFFVSLRMEHGHGRVKGETRSSVFLLELGLLGCKRLKAWKSH